VNIQSESPEYDPSDPGDSPPHDEVDLVSNSDQGSHVSYEDAALPGMVIKDQLCNLVIFRNLKAIFFLEPFPSDDDGQNTTKKESEEKPASLSKKKLPMQTYRTQKKPGSSGSSSSSSSDSSDSSSDSWSDSGSESGRESDDDEERSNGHRKSDAVVHDSDDDDDDEGGGKVVDEDDEVSSDGETIIAGTSDSEDDAEMDVGDESGDELGD
jgi:hypothetical protein